MPTPITRRSAIRFVGVITAASAASAASRAPGPAQSTHARAVRGYGTDPSMAHPVVTWPLTLDAAQREALAAVCDLVLPAQGASPSAAECGIHDFLDEWLSAPYPRMQQDRELVLRGLLELDRTALQAHRLRFAQARAQDRAQLFERVAGEAGPGRSFAIRLINLICGGYFTTPAGHTDMGYLGNQALAEFPAAAPEVIEQLTLAVDALARTWPKVAS